VARIEINAAREQSKFPEKVLVEVAELFEGFPCPFRLSASIVPVVNHLRPIPDKVDSHGNLHNHLKLRFYRGAAYGILCS
jgi:hypothetical protein